MKHKTLFLMAIILIPAVSAYTVDDFNRANNALIQNSWNETDPSGEISITDNTAKYAFTASALGFINKQIVVVGGDSITFQIYIDSWTADSFEINFYDAAFTSVLMFTYTNGDFYYYNQSLGGQQTLDEMNTGFWYNISIENIDFANDKADILINDTLIIENAPFRFAVNDITWLYTVGSVSTALTAYIDNILIGGVTPSYTNFTVTANDWYNNTPLMNLSAIINGTYYSTENGSLITTVLLESGFVQDMKLMCNDSGGYYDMTYNNLDMSAHFVGNMYQAVVYFNVTDEYTGENISQFNVTSQYQFNETATDQALIYMSLGEQIINTSKVGYRGLSHNISILPVTTSQHNLTLQKTWLEIEARNIYTNALISGFEVNVTDLTNSSTFINTTDNTSLTIGLNDQNFTLVVDATDYASATVNVTLTEGANNITVYMYLSSSLGFNFYDEETNQLIADRPVNFRLIDGTYAENFTTSNGTHLISNLTVYSYEIIYSARDYNQRSYFVDVGADTFENLTLYLLNDTVSEAIDISIKDENLNGYVGATLSVLRLFIEDTTPVWKIVEMEKSNFNGAGVIHIDASDTRYRFIITDSAGSVLLSSNETYVTTANLEFRVRETEQIWLSDSALRSGYYDITTTSNKTFVYTWSTGSNIINETCLIVTVKTALTDTEACNICSTASTGALQCDATAYNGVILAQAYVKTTTTYSTHLVDTLEWVDDNLAGLFGGLGVFLGTIFIGGVAALGVWNPAAAMIMAVLGLIGVTVSGIWTLGWYPLTSIIIVGMIIAFKSRS